MSGNFFANAASSRDDRPGIVDRNWKNRLVFAQTLETRSTAIRHPSWSNRIMLLWKLRKAIETTSRSLEETNSCLAVRLLLQWSERSIYFRMIMIEHSFPKRNTTKLSSLNVFYISRDDGYEGTFLSSLFSSFTERSWNCLSGIITGWKFGGNAAEFLDESSRIKVCWTSRFNRFSRSDRWTKDIK